MSIFNFGNKMDKTISQYLSINSKRKLSVIVCHKGNKKFVKNKIIGLNGTVKYEYQNINGFSCDLSAISAQKISEYPEVSNVTYDHKALLCLRKASDEMNFSANNSFKLTGRNINIGVIDTGVFPHPDLTYKRNSIKFFYDTVNDIEAPYDDNGHGTFICGCICSSGKYSDGLYKGIAPEANLYVTKSFDKIGRGCMSDIIKGIDILLSLTESDHIHILCLPFEFTELEDSKVKPMIDILKVAASKGIALIAPSGNSGPKPYSIFCPGNISDIITVGGTDPMSNGIKSLKTSTFSGRGPTSNNLSKPDLCAPSGPTISLSSDTSYIPGIHKLSTPHTLYTSASGTSVSCALITGFAALMLEKTNTLSPSDLKSLLTLLTSSYGDNKYAQGSGFFNFERLL